MATTTIKLTPRESQLRNLLLDVAHYIDESKEIKEKIELRFAGGWVRDKLLDIPSHDIDTAINAMTGFAFSTKMQDYLKLEENMKKHSLEAKDLGSLYKILANPEKSKHLETATTKIFGFDVDFVNLRKETYSEDSRNPQMEFGTAVEDAERRDATINALFYNLHSDQVEDFTGGLADLGAKRIRTPLEPRTTFMDDPLRVLRLIRFASRLNFRIDPATETFMSDPAVMEALKLKISRERVGVELEKMLKGNNPLSALSLIDKLGLYSTIFTDPGMENPPTPDSSAWAVVYNCLEQLRVGESPGSIYQSLARSDDSRYLAWVLAALTPWSTIPQTMSVKAKGKPSIIIGAAVAREGIKAETRQCNVIAGAFKNYEAITALKDAIKRKDPYTNERDTVGMAIRGWDAQGGHWRLHALFALLVEALNNNKPKEYEVLFGEWQTFIDHLEAMELMDVPSEKTILNGTQLAKELGGLKPGTWMKPTLDVIMAWQLRNPDKKEDWAGALEEVRKRSLPEKYSLEQLHDELVGDDEVPSKADELPKLLVISSCLSTSTRLHKAEDDIEYATKLALWISQAMLPSGNLVPHDEMPEEPNTSSRKQAIAAAQQKGTLGLTSLIELYKFSPAVFATSNTILLSILAFTSPHDPWTTPLSLSLATTILSFPAVLKYTRSSDFVTNYLLQTFIRHLFSKSRPEGITAAGRKAMPSSAPRQAFDVREMEKATRPWKYDVPYAITVFGWAVDNIEPSALLQTFHLFIPPLLTLLDEPSTPLRLRALSLLPTFIPSLTPKLLSQTGLGSVFEDTLLPILLYLPTLTPLDESLQLLPSAYKALFVLCSVRFVAGPVDHSKGGKDDAKIVEIAKILKESGDGGKERMKFLDRVMRKGILTGYLHASNHPLIVQTLLIQLSTLIGLMGIHCAKHISHIIHIITTTLADPFSTARPSLLLAAVKATQTLILTAWPRMSDQGHRLEIVKATVLCWRGVGEQLNSGYGKSKHGEDGVQGELVQVKDELKFAGRLLVKAVQANESVDFESELLPLVQADESLGVLFGIDSES